VVWHREQASWKVNNEARLNELHLRNSLLFQWSSLPMGRKRVTRYWSIAKTVAGGLIKGNNLWLTIYPYTLRDWCKMRKRHAGLKVSQQELTVITKAMNARLMSDGN